MANQTETDSLLVAKNDLAQRLEQVAVQLYFKPGEFNKNSLVWVDAKSAWESMNTLVDNIEIPVTPSP